MDVTPDRVARIPVQNLHISREAFADVWRRAEAELSRPGPDDHYLWGVVCTCRWLADAEVRSARTASGWESARSPIRRLRRSAHPELIEEEYLAAVRARRSSMPSMAGEGRGVLATLEWAWHRSRGSPLDVAEYAAG
jgi:hypothetical protein